MRRDALWLAILIAAGAPPVASAQVISIGGNDYVQRRFATREGLPQGTITGIAQTPDGFLWASTLGGLARFDGERFRVFNAASGDLPVTRKLVVLSCAQDDKCWCAGPLTSTVLFSQSRSHTVRSCGKSPR